MQRATFGFFKISKEIALGIETKLLEFTAQPRPVDESRTVVVNDEVQILLRNINPEIDGDYLLDFTRMKPGTGMDVSDHSGNEEKVQLPTNKKLAEFTVSLFDCKTGVLAVHETASGVTPSMIAKYWQTLLPALGKFRFDPVFEQRAVDDVMRAGGFSTFSLSLASMGNVSRLATLGMTQNEITDLIKKYSSPKISVVLRIDSKGSGASLAVERVRELATALLGLGKRHVKRLSFITEDEQGRDVLVNLLKDRIITKEDLTPTEKIEVTHDVRYRLARSAWNARKNEFRDRYEGAIETASS